MKKRNIFDLDESGDTDLIPIRSEWKIPSEDRHPGRVDPIPTYPLSSGFLILTFCPRSIVTALETSLGSNTREFL